MKLLALDSSTDIAQIALSDGQNYMLRELHGVREHSRRMLAETDALLAEAGWTLSMIDALVFGCGPGSFTGLRVSSALVQGIAYAQDLPAYPVSCLASIVDKTRASHPDAPVLALLDARMQQLYWSFAPAGAQAGEEFVTDAGAIQVEASGLILAGKAYEPFLAEMPAPLQASVERQLVQGPDVGAMIARVRAGLVDPVSAAEARPVYIRNTVTQGASSG